MEPRNKRLLVRVGGGVLGVLVLYGLWLWFVERVEVAPGKYLVRTRLTGKDLPEGQIIAPGPDYKGVQYDTLGEGRYFLNPFVWSYEIKDLVEVESNQCLVLTRKFGQDLPLDNLAVGNVLVGGDPDSFSDGDERGIVEKVLRQGRHRINPYAYDWKIEKAVQIGPQQVGVHILKVDTDPSAAWRWWQPRSPYLVPDGRRGVQRLPKAPGTYWINKHKEEIVPVDVGFHTVEFSDIVFPSRDGFKLRPHVLVRYRVLEHKAPYLHVTLTDEGQLSQADGDPKQQEANQILQKVVLPLIRGTVRIEGSKFDASEFLTRPDAAENPRERLRQKLREVVPPQCRVTGVDIEDISIGKLEETDLADVAKQITEREQARLERESNAATIAELRSRAKNDAETALAEQKKQLVEAHTRLETARIEAEGQLKKEEAKLEQEKKNAQLRLDAARAEARAVRARGQAEADVIVRQNEAEVAQLRTAVQGFASPEAYAQYQVLRRVAPALAEVFASDNSDFARLFGHYLAPAHKAAPMPQAAENAGGR